MLESQLRSIFLVFILFIILQIININLMDNLYGRNIGVIFIIVITIGAIIKIHLIYLSVRKQIIENIRMEK